MKKLITWLIIIIVLGGCFYYLMNYDKENPEDSDLIESTQDFVNDGIEKIDDGIDKGSDIINDYKEAKADTTNAE